MEEENRVLLHVMHGPPQLMWARPAPPSRPLWLGVQLCMLGHVGEMALGLGHGGLGAPVAPPLLEPETSDTSLGDSAETSDTALPEPAA